MSVRPTVLSSIHMKQLCPHGMDFREVGCVSIFTKICREIGSFINNFRSYVRPSKIMVFFFPTLFLIFNPFQSNFSATRILLFNLGGKEFGGLLVIILQF
jgi:hypothetical protein